VAWPRPCEKRCRPIASGRRRHPRRGHAARLDQLCLLFDTTAAHGQDIVPPRLVARLRRGVPTFREASLPRWAQGLLAPR